MPLRIDMLNKALTRIGAVPLQSETAPNGPRYVDVYNDVIGSLCSEYPWTFQTGFQQLAQLSGPTGNTWLYAYTLPSDLAGTPRALYNSISNTSIYAGFPFAQYDPALPPVVDFEIFGRTLYSNEPQLWMRYTCLPNPNLWPLYFQELATKLLMAELAVPAREDQTLREKLLLEVYGPVEHQGEGGLIAKCKAIDSQGRPSRTLQIGVNPLTAVRVT